MVSNIMYNFEKYYAKYCVQYQKIILFNIECKIVHNLAQLYVDIAHKIVYNIA